MRRSAIVRWSIALLALGVLGGASLLPLYRGGYLRLNYPSARRFPVLGVDVSHHQGPIDWGGLKGAGVEFAYLKSTEGGDFNDRRFAENARGAASAGVPFGAYHFFTFCTPGEAQAAHFLEVAPPGTGTLLPVVDIEHSGNCTRWKDEASVRRELRVFLERVERAWGRSPILYVTGRAHDEILDDAMRGRPLWLRDVLFEPAGSDEGRWLIWQYADNRRLPGVSGPIDTNVLRPGVSVEALYAR